MKLNWYFKNFFFLPVQCRSKICKWFIFNEEKIIFCQGVIHFCLDFFHVTTPICDTYIILPFKHSFISAMKALIGHCCVSVVQQGIFWNSNISPNRSSHIIQFYLITGDVRQTDRQALGDLCSRFLHNRCLYSSIAIQQS